MSADFNTQNETDSTAWRLRSVESNLARVEQKLDSHMEKVDARIARQSETVGEKLDQISRELQLSRASMPDMFVQRREMTDFMTDMRNRVESIGMRLERELMPRPEVESRVLSLERACETNSKAIAEINQTTKSGDLVRSQETHRSNIAIGTAILSVVASVVIHFLPPLHFGG